MDSNGLVDCKIKYYGGLSLMLEWPSKEMAWACMEENLTWLNQWFDSLNPWDDKEPFTRKLTWVCIDGFPIQGRHNRAIKPIVNKLGRILEIRRVDLNLKLIMLVKVLMLVTCSEEIKRSISISLNGYSMFKEEFVDPTMVVSLVRRLKDEYSKHMHACLSPSLMNNNIGCEPPNPNEPLLDTFESPKSSEPPPPPMHFNLAHSFVKDSCGHVHGLGMHNRTPHVGDNSNKDNLLPDLNVTLDKGEMEEHSDKELENLMASFQQLQENGMDQSQGISKNKRVKSKNKKFNIVGKSSSQPFLSQPINNGASKISNFLRQIGFELGYSFSQGFSLNFNGLGCLVKHDWVKDLLGSWLGVHGKISILNVYGPQAGHLKEILWTSIYSLLALVNVTWLIFRDFIVARFQEESIGYRFKAGEANVLNNFISRRSLFDFPLCGSKFTRVNQLDTTKREEWVMDLIQLDRFRNEDLKQICKILGSRLAKVIGSIIGLDQSTFIKGSQILDVCLITNEIVHMAKLEDQRMFLFKVDFGKAFDSVNWNFLLDIMRKMGFGLKWRKWISLCLSLASITVLINGSYSNNFFMERDLRQREPLSPFSFILVVEALQVTILNACDRGIFKGACLSNSGKNISLLQCADDALLFGEWMAFGVRVLDNEVSTVASSLGCAYRTHPFSYLGLTVGGKMGLCNSWQEIINRFKDRLLTWKTKTLFIGGRLTLVKSILEFYSSDGGFGSSILANSESGVWLDAVKACKCIEDKFPKLFALEIDKDCGQVANNVSIGNWLWRIPPRARALGDLNMLSSKLGNVKFSSYGSDKWSWSYDSSESFKVKILSKVLENNLLGDISLGLHYK
ncbi:putative RNA-directed DNA polymerase, eukaryota, reverse transcriptase zinc-binding domain protein [Tanacetum coccineum]